MKEIRPDKHALTSVRLIVLALALAVTGAAKLYIPIDIVVIIIGIAVLTAVIFFDCIYFPLYFSNLYYETDGKTITKYSGVIFRTNRTIRYSTVQYTAVVTTPFSKFTGLNFAVLFVYGGQLRLIFLDHRDCAEIVRLASVSGKEGV